MNDDVYYDTDDEMTSLNKNERFISECTEAVIR